MRNSAPHSAAPACAMRSPRSLRKPAWRANGSTPARSNWPAGRPVSRKVAQPAKATKGQADPDNRLIWRRAPRRLEAEVIRDSMLTVSGQLDRTMYGKGTLNEGMKRRSIYFIVSITQYRRAITQSIIDIFIIVEVPDTGTFTMGNIDGFIFTPVAKIGCHTKRYV